MSSKVGNIIRIFHILYQITDLRSNICTECFPKSLCRSDSSQRLAADSFNSNKPIDTGIKYNTTIGRSLFRKIYNIRLYRVTIIDYSEIQRTEQADDANVVNET